MTVTTAPAAKAGWWIAAVFSIAIALISYRYLIGVDTAPNVVGNAFARPWLSIHVAGAATALLVGAFQFIPRLRRRGGPHRLVGRIYIIGCLAGGMAGFILALGTTSGSGAGLGFGSLALVWIFVNARGWQTALAGDFVMHRRWMIRAWALTLGAVTLRIELPLSLLSGIPFSEAYPAISFLAWMPNLIVAELYLRVGTPRRVAARVRQATSF